jgi:hypothetical protein
MAGNQDNTFAQSQSRLSDVVRQLKIEHAERGDVVVDMKEADRARLELLAEALVPVIEDVPLDDDRFDFALSSGLQPRLWIDATAHVMMGRDRRTYRFVRDTRLGRVVLAESADIDPVTEAVTDYVAERMLERERVFAGETVSFRPSKNDHEKEGVSGDKAHDDNDKAAALADDADKASHGSGLASTAGDASHGRDLPAHFAERSAQPSNAAALGKLLIVLVLLALGGAGVMWANGQFG